MYFPDFWNWLKKQLTWHLFDMKNDCPGLDNLDMFSSAFMICDYCEMSAESYLFGNCVDWI